MDSVHDGHTTRVRVRYAETDRMGIAYNGHYLTWFEVGRTEMLRELGFTYHGVENDGYRLPLLEAGVKYLKPALYDDVLTIATSIGKKPGVRLRLEYTIARNDEILASGFTEHVFTDCDLKPVKPPKNLLSCLNEAWERSDFFIGREK
jgi:acyl-CoA thioester hydrolase